MIDKLRAFGLDSYEARVYAELSRIGTSTSTAVSRASGVPYGRIYPVLYSLEKKGFVRVIEGKPKRFTAVEPRIALAGRVERKARELEALKTEVDSLIPLLERAGEPPAASESVQVIQGKLGVLNLSVRLHKKAKGEYRSISRLPIYKPHLDAYREAVKRGVKFWVLTPQTDSETVNVWTKLGVELRYSEDIELRYTVVDKTDVVIRIGSSDRTGYTSLWIQNTALASIMAQNFDRLWKKSKPIEDMT
jgi:sugar-specific transcriptional regulator TrmB